MDDRNEKIKPDDIASSSKLNTNKSKKTVTKLLIALLFLAIITGLIYGAWYTISTKNDRIHTLENQIEKLTDENKKLKNKITSSSNSNNSSNTNTSNPVSETSKINAADKENIIASITSGNTAALEQKMNNTVLVILAASEGMGQRTSTQAVSDLSYVVSATQPWDFNPSATTLANYKNGDYSQYFPDDAIVGTSADGKVISITMGTNGKISTIFMSVSSEIL